MVGAFDGDFDADGGRRGESAEDVVVAPHFQNAAAFQIRQAKSPKVERPVQRWTYLHFNKHSTPFLIKIHHLLTQFYPVDGINQTVQLKHRFQMLIIQWFLWIVAINY